MVKYRKFCKGTKTALAAVYVSVSGYSNPCYNSHMANKSEIPSGKSLSYHTQPQKRDTLCKEINPNDRITD